MGGRLLSLVLLLSAAASATTFTAHVERVDGAVPAVYFFLQVRAGATDDCGGYIPRVAGVAVKTDEGGIRLYPDKTTGDVTVEIEDQANITCGTSTGVAFYRVTMFYRDANAVWRKGPANDYDITGATFVLQSATPRNASSIAPVIANADAIKNILVAPTAPTNGQGLFYSSTTGKYQPASPGALSAPRRFYPAESCNGSNLTFTFGASPAAADQFHLFWNGLALDLTDDYGLSGAVASMVRPCKTGDKVYAIF